MAFNFENLSEDVTRFLQLWKVARVCPELMQAPEELLKFNILTLGVTLVIFMLARSTVSGAELSVSTDVAATIISSVIAFCTGYVVLIFSPGSDTSKWSTFFTLTWITSLICAFLLDGILVSNHRDPLSTDIIDWFFTPGSLPAIVKDTMRAVGFSVIALIIMIVKTKFMDRTFRIFSKCGVATVVGGLLVNTLLLLAFLYRNVI
jgi:hypothetical protein